MNDFHPGNRVQLISDPKKQGTVKYPIPCDGFACVAWDGLEREENGILTSDLEKIPENDMHINELLKLDKDEFNWELYKALSQQLVAERIELVKALRNIAKWPKPEFRVKCLYTVGKHEQYENDRRRHKKDINKVIKKFNIEI